MDADLPLVCAKAPLALLLSKRFRDSLFPRKQRMPFLAFSLVSHEIGMKKHDKQTGVISWRSLYESNNHDQ
jgi:hypothetical protein